MTMYLYYFVRMYITTVLLYSDSCLYWCLAYICEGIFALRMYVTIVIPYSQDRGITPFEGAHSSLAFYQTSWISNPNPFDKSEYLFDQRYNVNVILNNTFSRIYHWSTSWVYHRMDLRCDKLRLSRLSPLQKVPLFGLEFAFGFVCHDHGLPDS